MTNPKRNLNKLLKTFRDQFNLYSNRPTFQAFKDYHQNHQTSHQGLQSALVCRGFLIYSAGQSETLTFGVVNQPMTPHFLCRAPAWSWIKCPYSAVKITTRNQIPTVTQSRVCTGREAEGEYTLASPEDIKYSPSEVHMLRYNRVTWPTSNTPN